MHSSSSILLIARAAPWARVSPESAQGCRMESDRSRRNTMQPGVARENVCSYTRSPWQRSGRAYGWSDTAPSRLDDGRGPWGARRPLPHAATAATSEREPGGLAPHVHVEIPALRALHDAAHRAGPARNAVLLH